MIDDDILLVGILLGIIIGGSITILVISAGEQTLVEDSFLDNVCNFTFGEGYVYYDDNIVGFDNQISCTNSNGWITRLN